MTSISNADDGESMALDSEVCNCDAKLMMHLMLVPQT